MATISNITKPLKELVADIINEAAFGNHSNTNPTALLSMLDLDYETVNVRMLVFTVIFAVVLYFTFTKTLYFCRDLLRTAIKICLYSVAVIPVIAAIFMLYFWARGDAPDRINDIIKVAVVLNISKADVINKIPFI